MRVPRLWSPSRLRVVLAALTLVACDTGTVGFSGPNRQQSGGSSGPDSTAGLTLTVTPDPVKISVGSKGQFTARLQDALGNPVAGIALWSSNNTAIATIDTTGQVTGISAGTTTISAAEHGLATSASLEVDPVPVASVATAPRFDTLQVGTQVTLTATTKDAVGNTLAGRQITWLSRSPSIATVSASGVVTAVAVGVDSVIATSEGVSGASVITVVNVPVASVVVAPTPDTVPLGGTGQLTATPKDSAGNPLVRAVSWSSANTAVATVSGAGLVSGVGVGTTTITASAGGQSGTATVTVIQVPVATVTVTPANPSVQIGKTVQLTATTRDAKGNTLTGRVVTWGSGTPANATVNGSGLVSGVAQGTSVITATSETINGSVTATVTVPPPTLVRIIMSPDTATINTGTTKQFSTVGKYSDSSTAAVTPTYTATGGTVTASGLYTAGSTGGTFRVIAALSGLADTSTVTVVKPPVALVIVTPALDTVAVGSSYQLTATTKDAGGNVLTGRVVTWGTSNTAVATVNGSGLVSAVGAGTATITATSETVPGTATTVANVVLAKTVSVTPTSSTVRLGSSALLTATARDALGNILTGHPTSWVSLSPATVSVSATGTVTALGPGSATIKATVDTASGSATVLVDTTTALKPWLLEDFSTYSSTANWLSDPRGIYSVAEDEGTGQMTLDQTGGVNIDGYNLNQAARYDYVAPGCTSQTLERNLVLPQSVPELWFELYIKFTTNFTTKNVNGCSTPPDFKMFFLRINEAIGRGAVRWGSQTPPEVTVEIGNSVDLYTGAFISQYSDNKWHRLRGHWRLNGTASVIELSIDGVTVYNNHALNAGGVAPVFYGLSMGRNLDQGVPSGTMSEWWGRLAVFNTNPGWSF